MIIDRIEVRVGELVRNARSVTRRARRRLRPRPAVVVAKRDHTRADEHIDAALADSFPASDPPPWTLGAPAWSAERETS